MRRQPGRRHYRRAGLSGIAAGASLAAWGVEGLNPEIERLFFAVADLDPAARRRYLDEQHVDAETRAAVERLVEFDRGAATFLGTPLASVAAKIEQNVPATQTDHVGPYKLIREIGRGGMGAVYEAERSDGELRLRVAVKFVSRAIRSDFVVERFKRERQILANLNHPNICRLIDAGTAEDGSPYLVMELIEGQPIDEWSRGKSVREICDLFRHVCDAVQHAHRNMVVHRDLKPGNILVTVSSETRAPGSRHWAETTAIGRFSRKGAAEPKLLDFGIAKLLDSAPVDLQNTMRALTPDYASPEQHDGRPITAATDIYGLGCVLYHLLTGKPPRRLPGQETAPPASSVKPELAGDLDAILARAMQPKPADRYATAREFSEELCRFLAREPVNAAAGGFGYIAVRFARRHRWIAAAMAGVTLFLTAGAGYAWWRSWQAERQLNALSASLDDTNAALSGAPGKLVTAVGEQLAARPGNLSSIDLLRSLGKYDEASKALADLDESASVLLLQSQVAVDRGRFQEAAKLARRALSLVADAPPVQAARVALQSAALDQRVGRLTEARGTLERAMGKFEMPQMAAASSLLGAILQDLGDLTQSRRMHEAALRLDPGNFRYHARFAQLLDASGERERALAEWGAMYKLVQSGGVIASPEARLERLTAYLRYAESRRATAADEANLVVDLAAAQTLDLADLYPDNRYTQLAWARTHVAQRNAETADRLYGAYTERYPDDTEALREFALNRLAWARQSPAAAQACDGKVLRLNDTSHPAVAALARQLQQICNAR